MTDPEDKVEPDEFSNFDRAMRALVNVDPAELNLENEPKPDDAG